MYDAIVVGAGPSGSLTAHGLAREGVDVLLLEKETLPRYKPCGGGLPPHAVSLLERRGIVLDSVVENVAESVKFMFDFEDPVTADLSDAPVVMVNRADFDGYLVEEASSAGAEFRDGTGVSDVQQNGDGCRVKLDNGEVLDSRFVIGADGAGSRVAKSIGQHEQPTYGVALDAEVELDSDTYEREATHATFNINFIEKGYGWIFPKDGYLAMGVGGYNKDVNYPEQIRTFMDRSLPEAQIENMDLYGHPLPFFDGDAPLGEGRVALVGDAANMVDALSGEGIFYALKAGVQAADSVVEALAEGRADLTNYRESVDGTVLNELRWSSRLASVFFQFPRKCYEHGVKRPSVVNMIKEVVRSEQSYDDIYESIWAEVKQRLSPSALARLAYS